MLNKWLVNLTKYITTHITSSNYFLLIVKSYNENSITLDNTNQGINSSFFVSTSLFFRR